jgi:hypothetical protein
MSTPVLALSISTSLKVGEALTICTGVPACTGPSM